MLIALLLLVMWFGFSIYYTARALNGTFLFKNAILNAAALAPLLLVLSVAEFVRKKR